MVLLYWTTVVVMLRFNGGYFLVTTANADDQVLYAGLFLVDWRVMLSFRSTNKDSQMKVLTHICHSR